MFEDDKYTGFKAPKVWAPELLESLAYHESGHILAAISAGSIVNFAWIGDGKHMVKFDSPGVTDSQIEGETMSHTEVQAGDLRSLAEQMFHSVATGIAPQATEKLAPNHESFIGLKKKFEGFYYEDSGFTAGSVNDMLSAWNFARIIYEMLGGGTWQIFNWFEKFFVLPENLQVRQYEKQIHEVAQLLMKERVLYGEQIHKVICAEGLPHCSHDGILDPVFRKEIEKSVAAIDTQLLDGKINRQKLKEAARTSSMAALFDSLLDHR